MPNGTIISTPVLRRETETQPKSAASRPRPPRNRSCCAGCDKEKMQSEAQLSQYEKYPSLAQLGLGAAHEINNPLLGILSHLELEWKDVGEERRQEIEQCIEGAKRISAAVRGLLDYAYPGARENPVRDDLGGWALRVKDNGS